MDDDVITGEINPENVASTLAVNGEFSAAILMMLLEDGDAAAILQHLTPTEVKALGKGMFEAANASEHHVERALENFVSSNRDLSSLAVGAPHRIRGMMHQALGNVRADNILAEIAPESSAPSLDILRWMDLASITQLVASEHPQVAAVILSVLTPEVSAQAIAGFDEAKQTDLLFRSARLESVPSAAIEDLEAILALYSGHKAEAPQVKLGGRNDVAKIVNNLSRPLGEKLLRSLRKKDRLLADAIEEEMFVFGDLAQLDAKALGAILRNIDADKIALAIKGASELLGDKMLSTLSARAAETIRDDIAEMSQVKRADVEEAQKAVITVARQMAATGEINLGGGSDDYV
jgi:flagellar motor switch protein FliG